MAITIEQFIAKQNQRIAELQKNTPLGKAAATVQARIVQRVFVKGITSFNSKIGKYNSTNALYISPKRSPRKLPTKGKTGLSVFKNGRAHKTTFYSSYKSFRAKQGRQNAFIDLTLFGNLRSDFSNSLQQVSITKWIAGTKRKENTVKMQGNEKRFGEIFSLTQAENELFQATAQAEFLKIMTS